jgi:precorrin-2 methylase
MGREREREGERKEGRERERERERDVIKEQAYVSWRPASSKSTGQAGSLETWGDAILYSSLKHLLQNSFILRGDDLFVLYSVAFNLLEEAHLH